VDELTHSNCRPCDPITSSIENSLADKGDAVDLSPRLRADLLDLDAWGEILTTYGRTMRAAVALTDTTVTYWGNVTMPAGLDSCS